MLVIAIASQKGGCGKTTLSGHLAVEAEKAGAGPVAVIDTDPQGSLSGWWNARVAKTPVFAKVSAFDLAGALEHLKQQGISLVIIDTPPAITDAISHVITAADLVIVPTRPSPHDLRAVGATIDLAEIHNKPLIFVVNGATAKARITSEAAVTLSQHGTVAPVTVHNRVDFAASMVDGRTVGEISPKSQSAKEIAVLWVYVQNKLARLTRGPRLSREPTLSSEPIPPCENEGLPLSTGTALVLSDCTELVALSPVVCEAGTSLVCGVAEAEVPESEVSETEVPETEMPETEVPETEVPETEVPETEVPALPPIVWEGGQAAVRDVERLTNWQSDLRELQTLETSERTFIERRESPRPSTWFAGAGRKLGNFGRRNVLGHK